MQRGALKRGEDADAFKSNKRSQLRFKANKYFHTDV